MSNRLLAAALAVLGLGAPLLPAQDFPAAPVDAAAPPPAPPFVRQDEAAAYAVAFVYPGGPASAAPRDTRLEVEKAGTVRHEVRRRDDGVMETWYVGTEQLAKRNPFGTPVPEAMFAAAPLDGSLSFPELAWVGPGTFAGAIRLGKRTIDVFRREVGPAAEGFEPFLFHQETVTAYVDEESRLPLALKTSQYTATYVLREPTARLDLPPEYAAAYQSYKKRVGLP